MFDLIANVLYFFNSDIPDAGIIFYNNIIRSPTNPI